MVVEVVFLAEDAGSELYGYELAVDFVEQRVQLFGDSSDSINIVSVRYIRFRL